MSVTKSEKRALSPYRQKWKAIAAVAFLAIVSGFLETVTIVSIVAFIDGVTTGDLAWEIAYGPIDLALGRAELAAVASFSLVGMTVGQLLASWIRVRAVSDWQFQMQMTSTRAFLNASWGAQSGETSGSLQNLMNMSWATSQGLGALMNLLSAAGSILVFAFTALVVSPVAAVVLVVVGVLLSLMLRPVRKSSRSATDRATVAQREVAEHVGEVHDLAQEIRVHYASGPIEAQLRSASRQLRRARQRAAVLSSLGSVMYRSVGLAVVLAATILVSGQTDLDLARVGVAGLLLLRSLGYGQNIQTAWQQIENNRPAFDRVAEALESYRLSAPASGSVPLDELRELLLDGVSYQYEGADEFALHDLNLELARGETLGVVGPSGGGKSTLVQLLLGLRRPTSGSYSTSGIPCASVLPSDWFRLVTVVPQQPQLLRASVRQNIRFFRRWISDDEVEEAARQAGLHEEIKALPNEYETQIGAGARDLSGGQRQRLGIARALAGRPELLVLDEPTSALDAMSEARIQETLQLLKGSVTVVIVAHRLATLNHCDRVLVLEEGRVVALGKPRAVLDQSEFFKEATRLQLVDVSD